MCVVFVLATIECDMYGQVVLLENCFNRRNEMDEVNLQKPVGDKVTFRQLKVDYSNGIHVGINA